MLYLLNAIIQRIFPINIYLDFTFLWFVCVCCISHLGVSDSLWLHWLCSPTGISVHRILQATILEWVAIPFSMASSKPRDQTQVSCIAGRFFPVWSTRDTKLIMHSYRPNKIMAFQNFGKSCIHSILSSVQFSSVAQSCPTLCDPMNCSTPGLPVHHQLWESTQTHVHRVGDAIQPSHPLLSPSPPAPNPS